MSSTFPPDGPQGSGPEYLEHGRGGPLEPRSTPSRNRRPLLIAGGAIVALGVVGGAVWAVTSYLGTGPQPAEALPASTLGYASIDLDPSASQKIEAVTMLRKFPAIKKELGLDTGDDLRRKLFDLVQDDVDCKSLDYGDDIEPWIGSRAAVAAVDTGDDQPTPVLVLQVTDEDAAQKGLAEIQSCAPAGDNSGGGSDNGGSDELGGWAINDGWVVVAETDKLASTVAADAAESSLADDSDFQSWSDQVGDAGIINLYAAPAAGRYLADNLGEFGPMLGGGSGSASSGSCTSDSEGSETCLEDMPSPSSDVPDEVSDALKDFKGMAATVRFDDGALELEVAGDPGVSQKGLYGTDAGDDVLATLPADTAAALGVGLDKGWFTDLVEQLGSYGGASSPAELLAELSDSSGLDLPGDAETLAGESFSLSVGSDFDPETAFNSGDGSDVPVAAKVKGDSDAIAGVLDKVRGQLGPQENVLGSDSDGDLTVIGPDADYRSEVLKDGGLGDTDAFQNVVREAGDASAIFFVNFDAGDWLVKVASGDQELTDNLEPLEGLGLSAWQEDDAGHAVLRLTTN